MTTITFDNAPKEAIDIAIDMMIISNPETKLSRVEWAKLVEDAYDIEVIDSNIVLEPKEITKCLMKSV